MRKFLFILFACLCSLATWAQTTKSGNVNFWYYDYSASTYHNTYVDDAITKAITSTDIKVGSNLKDNGPYDNTILNTQESGHEWKMERITYTSDKTSADDTNAIDFTINLKDGYNFTPSAVSLTIKGGRSGDTSKQSYIDFAWNGVALGGAQEFTSDNATHQFKFSSTDFESVEASTTSCALRIHLYGTPYNSEWFVCDVKITGTVTNPDGEKYELTFSPESNVGTGDIMRSIDQVIIGAYGDDMTLSTLTANSTPSTTSYYYDGSKEFGFWVYKEDACLGAIVANTDTCYSQTDKKWTFTSKVGEDLEKEPFTDGGTYTIYIPAEIFTSVGLEGNMTNDAYTVSYVITPYGEFNLNATPTSGSKISELDYVYLAYQGGLTTTSSDSQGISIYSGGELVASSDTTSYVLYPSAYDSATNTYALAVFESSKASEPTSITEAGTYTITIPAKYFMNTNKDAYNNEITLSYTISEATKFEVSLTSPTTTIVDEISDFTITPAEGTTISSLSEEADAQPTLIDGLYNTIAYGVGTLEEDNTVTITLKDAEGNTVTLTKDNPDTYMLIIPEGYIIASDESVNSRLTAEFTIEKVAVPDEFVFNPVTGSTLGSLKTIEITNANEDNGLMIKYAPFGEGYEKTGLIVVLNESGNHVSCVPDFKYVQEEFDNEESADTKVIIKFEPEVTIAGEYTVVIPSGLLNFGYDSDEYNDEIELTYTVESDVTGFEFEAPQVTSEEVTILSSSATISLSALEGFTLSEDNTDKIAITLSGKEDVSAYATLADVDGVWTLSFVNASGEATTLSEAGDYVITIPQGYFVGDDGAINPKTLITFSVSLVTFDLTATLGDLAEDGKSIAITFNPDEITVNEDADQITVSANGSAIATAYGTLEEAEEGWTLSFTDADGKAVAITDDAIYTITIPEGYFKDADGAESIEVSVNFTIGDVEEKVLYSTSWIEWDEIDRTTAVGVEKTVKTNYTNEDLTFTFNGVGVDPTKTDDSKFPGYVGAMITGKYPSEIDFAPSATTSALQSITKIDFTQVATGSKRGIKISVKGDEDEDWVALFDQAISNAKGEDHTLEVNRTNCQIKFENYNDETNGMDNNAYIVDLKIYGEASTSAHAITFDPISGLNVDTLSVITAVADTCITTGSQQVLVTNASGEIVTTVKAEVSETSDEEPPTTTNTCTLKLSEEVTDDGVYTVSIPYGYFEFIEDSVYSERIAINGSDSMTVYSFKEIGKAEAYTLTYKITTVYDELTPKVSEVEEALSEALATIKEEYPTALDDETFLSEIEDIEESIEQVKEMIEDYYASSTLNANQEEVEKEIEALSEAIAALVDEAAQVVYDNLTAEVEDLSDNLAEVWSEIETSYQEAAKDEDILAKKTAIEEEISDLQKAIDESNEEGTLGQDVEDFEAQIAAIQTEIEQLLKDAIATGIDSITTDAMGFEGKSVYTISGQKVSAPTKAGIYIIDGKKVLIK